MVAIVCLFSLFHLGGGVPISSYRSEEHLATHGRSVSQLNSKATSSNLYLLAVNFDHICQSTVC